MKWNESSKVFTLTLIFIILPTAVLGIWFIIDITVFQPIIISGDEELAKYASQGEGTESSPYIIEGINLKTYHKQGIIIMHTERYFILQHCYFKTAREGIRLSYLKNDTAIVRYNSLKDCSIVLYKADGVDILDNTISGLGELQISSSTYLTVYNNHFGEYGIYFINEYVWYDDEDLYRVPFIFDDYENNTVGNLDIIFFSNSSNLIINQPYGQIFLLDCSNITVLNQEMKKVKLGVYAYQTNNCLIENCFFNNCQNGIYINTTTNFSIYNNVFCNLDLQLEKALMIEESFFGEILNNTFQTTKPYNFISLYNSGNITVHRNFLQGSHTCLQIYQCENILVIKNQLEDASFCAIYIYESSFLNIYLNNFIDNSQYYETGSQVVEIICSNILWYNMSLSSGNYYSDYSGIGSYVIPTGNYDIFPLTTPVDIYT